MDDKLVSVIVPVYNCESYLERSLDSIRLQSYKNLEIIVVDDGSKDKSGLIADEYALNDSRIKVFHVSNAGVSNARNIALEHTVGDYIMFVDSDDWMLDGSIMKMVKKLEEDDTDVAIFSLKEIFRGTKTEIIRSGYRQDKWGLINDYINNPWVSCWGALFKRNLFRDNKLSFPTDIAYWEDFMVMMQVLVNASKIVVSEEPVYMYFRDNESSATHQKTMRNSRDELIVYNRVIDYYRSKQALQECEESLTWRLLKAAQFPMKAKGNLGMIHKVKRKYIISCPWISRKMKFLMLCATCEATSWFPRVLLNLVGSKN